MLLVLGCGYVGVAVARRASAEGVRVVGTTRSAERAAQLRAIVPALEVVTAPVLEPRLVRSLVGPDVDVLVAFPPDGPAGGTTDAAIAPAVSGARAVVYVSSTAVYGRVSGTIDDTTPVRADGTRARLRLEAEDAWRAIGATVLRAPAIYGPDRGLHVRVRAGTHRIPGDGRNHVSRIHVEDLASLVLASLRTPEARGATFVVGDLEPAPHVEVVRFVCASSGVPMPASIPVDDSDETLRADRRVDPSRALATLGVTLRYPSYREGMA